MTLVLVFAAGVAVGFSYEKAIGAWKRKIARAAKAAQTAMQD